MRPTLSRKLSDGMGASVLMAARWPIQKSPERGVFALQSCRLCVPISVKVISHLNQQPEVGFIGIGDASSAIIDVTVQGFASPRNNQSEAAAHPHRNGLRRRCLPPSDNIICPEALQRACGCLFRNDTPQFAPPTEFASSTVIFDNTRCFPQKGGKWKIAVTGPLVPPLALRDQ
ncbi:MAG: hypothetical protein U5L02_10280 [Rheinheimera sp.]|nr:hypothetical protein [Rheinheimera sp.]